MNNESVVLLGLLVLLFTNGSISVTQALLLAALYSTNSRCNCLNGNQTV